MVIPVISGFQHAWMRTSIIPKQSFPSRVLGGISTNRAPSWLLVSSMSSLTKHNERNNNAVQPSSNAVKIKDRRKQKVALVAGFLGSKYYGLQMGPYCKEVEGERFLPTIENEIRLAMFKGQYIKPDNAMDLSKINWSRSSRTDKGVHANRVVFCGYLEIPFNGESTAIEENKATSSSKAAAQQNRSSSSSSQANRPSNSLLLSSSYGLLDANMTTSDALRFPNIVSTLNEHLPEDIRVFAATKINNAFSAKDSCQWRGYEYYMPIEILANNKHNQNITNIKKANELVDKLNRFLHEMEGCHGFHNFHRLSEKELKKVGLKQKIARKFASRGTRTPRQTDSDDIDKPAGSNNASEIANVTEVTHDELSNDNHISSEEIADVEEISEEDPALKDGDFIASIVSNSKNGPPYSDRFFDDNWVPTHRETHIKTKCTIYRCHATLLKVPNSDKLMVKVNIVGHYFLLHQIRLMLGAAILCTTDVLPSFFIRLATVAPVAFRLPLVPAEGLVLSTAGFHNSKQGPDIALSSSTAAGSNKLILMNTEEEQQSEHFLISKILPRVVEDWSRENNSLLQQWSSYCSQRFLPSPKTLGQWQQLLSKYETTFQAYENHRNERERNRISFQVNLFYKDIQQRENEIIKMKESIRAITKEIEGKTNQTSETKRTGEKSKNELDKLQYKLAALKNKLRKLTDPSDGKILLLRGDYPHRLYLPNTVATLICVKFQVPPCPLVSEALRALATRNILTLKNSYSTSDVSKKQGKVQADKAPVDVDYANPQYYVNEIEEEVNRLIKKRKDLSKDLQDPKNWSGHEKLRLWTNSQHKHLFVG